MMDDLRDQVRRRYAEAATTAAGCCGPSADCGADLDADAASQLASSIASGLASDLTGAELSGDADDPRFGSYLYAGDLAGLPVAAVATSLGCGDPTAVADLREGEVVLDLGSGAGLDVLLSGRRVGPTGRAYGLDMTDEMLELARANALEAGADNVEFLHGQIEDIPLPDATVDVVLSNCVVNLSTDKPAVFRELARVVRPGGRLAISDVVADDGLSPQQRAERGSYVGCIAGALSFDEFRTGLAAAGFVDVEVEPTHEVADGMHAAIVRGVRAV